MIVVPPGVDGAKDAVADLYAEDINADGFVYTHTQAMAINPEAYAAFMTLIQSVVGSIGFEVYEAATLGAARATGCTQCLLAHGRNALRGGAADENTLERFACGQDDGFSPSIQAVIRYAERLSLDPSSMTDADSQELRDAGFSDRQIVDITLAAAARNLLSRTLLALAVPVDQVPGIPPRLAAALGRTR